MNAERNARAVGAKALFWRQRARVALSAAVLVLAVQPAVGDADEPATADLTPPVEGVATHSPVVEATAVDVSVSRHHVLEGTIADVLVEIRGGRCTGTPITGTKFVVTAAHCVLSEDGQIIRRTVVRDGVAYDPVAVLVDTDYHLSPDAELDAAVLVMPAAIPGPAAQLGESIPGSGLLTLAGLQPTDRDGSLLRAEGATGDVIPLRSRPAGCVERADTLDVSPSRVFVHCGLIPGASGGGLFAQGATGPVLVGIVSSVTADLSANGVVPLSSLHEILQHPGLYTHLMLTVDDPRDHLPSLLA